MAIDRAKFFDGIRNGPFPGSLTAGQVEGITIILDAWDRSGFTDMRDLAYILATPIVETGWTMQPIKEKGGQAYYHRMYDIEGSRPAKARELGNIHPGDGAKFCGMGFVQSTGRSNARKLTALVKEIFGDNVDFEETPERLMEPKYAALALIVGLERGIFTGRKLSHYLRSSPPNWREARRTVNGLDRADEIGGYAKQIYADLVEAQDGTPAAQPSPPVAPPQPKAPEAPKPNDSPAGRLEPTKQDGVIWGILTSIGLAIVTAWTWLREHPAAAIAITVAVIGIGFAVWHWWKARQDRAGDAGLAAVADEFSKPEPDTDTPVSEADSLAAAIANKARGAVACQEAVTTAMAKPVRRKARKKPKKPAKRPANKKRKAS